MRLFHLRVSERHDQHNDGWQQSTTRVALTGRATLQASFCETKARRWLSVLTFHSPCARHQGRGRNSSSYLNAGLGKHRCFGARLCACAWERLWKDALGYCHNYMLWMQQLWHLFKKKKMFLSVFDLWLSSRCHSEGNYELWMDIICTRCLCERDILPTAGAEAVFWKSVISYAFECSCGLALHIVRLSELVSVCVCADIETAF